MRRTQNVSSYVTMFLTLIGGIAFMVGFLTHDGFNTMIHNFVYLLLEQNLAIFAGIGALIVLACFYGLLRYRFTV